MFAHGELGAGDEVFALVLLIVAGVGYVLAIWLGDRQAAQRQAKKRANPTDPTGKIEPPPTPD